MTTEQGGAPSASAGGAPAYPFAGRNCRCVVEPITDGCSLAGPWDVGHSPATGGRNLYVRSADGDVYVGVIFEPADAARIVEVMNAAEQPRLADPRAAELAQLRTALARYQKRLGDDLLCGGKLVERVRAALRVDNGGTCTRASMDGVVGDVGRLCDEVERLRLEVASARSIADEKRAVAEKLRGELDDLSAERDDLAERLEANRNARDTFRRWRDEAAEQWKAANAEVTRLKRLVGDENVPYYGWDGLSRQEAIVRCEEGWQEYLKVRDERDRLRQELAEQRPKFQPEQRVRVGNGECFGTVHTTLERYTVEIDDVHFLVDLPPAFLTALPDDKAAEPRRWIAGDPEPEIGTTVSTGKFDYTRGDDGSWYRPSAPSQPLTWQSVTYYTPVVEVVGTDG